MSRARGREAARLKRRSRANPVGAGVTPDTAHPWAGRAAEHPHLGHPSKQSILSGSTDWRNGPRAVLTLESSSAPDAFLPKADGKPSATRVPAVRLRLDKANYASAGKQCWVRKAKASDMDEDGWGRRLTMLRLEECTSYESAVAHAVETGAPLPVQAGDE